MIFKGADTEIGFRRFLKWWLQGLRQVSVELAPGICVTHSTPWWLIRSGREAFWRRADRFGQEAWALVRSKKLSKLLAAIYVLQQSHANHHISLVAIESLGRGGAEKQAILRAQDLVSQGEKVVLLINTEIDDQALAVRADIDVQLQPKREQLGEASSSLDETDVSNWLRLWQLVPGDVWKSCYAAYFAIRKCQPKAVTAYLDWTNITVGLAAVLAGVPRVRLSFRSYHPGHYEFFRPEFLGIYRALAQLPGVSFEANSFAGRDSYAKWLRIPKSAIEYVPNIEVSSDETKAVDSLSSVRNESGFTIGWLGRYSHQKDPHLWISVIENLARDYPQVKGVMAGEGALEREVIEQLQERGLTSLVKMLGVIADSSTYFSALNLLLLTSRSDGTPNVAIEAAQVDLPVLATSSGDLLLMQERFANLTVTTTRDPEKLSKSAVKAMTSH